MSEAERLLQLVRDYRQWENHADAEKLARAVEAAFARSAEERYPDHATGVGCGEYEDGWNDALDNMVEWLNRAAFGGDDE